MDAKAEQPIPTRHEGAPNDAAEWGVAERAVRADEQGSGEAVVVAAPPPPSPPPMVMTEPAQPDRPSAEEEWR